MDWTGKRVKFIDESLSAHEKKLFPPVGTNGTVVSETEMFDAVLVKFDNFNCFGNEEILTFKSRLEIIDKEQENKMNEIKPTMMYTKADLETAYKMGYEKGRTESTKIEEPKKVWEKAVYNKLKVGDKVRFVGNSFFDEEATNKIISFSGIKCGEECTVTDWIDGILVAEKDDNDPVPLNFCIFFGVGVEVLV